MTESELQSSNAIPLDLDNKRQKAIGDYMEINVAVITTLSQNEIPLQTITVCYQTYKQIETMVKDVQDLSGKHKPIIRVAVQRIKFTENKYKEYGKENIESNYELDNDTQNSTNRNTNKSNNNNRTCNNGE